VADAERPIDAKRRSRRGRRTLSIPNFVAPPDRRPMKGIGRLADAHYDSNGRKRRKDAP
jgi:hypothetical protein